MTTEERAAKSSLYREERVDSLPFNTPEKSDRYRTERFSGAIGLNWFDCDPTLQRSMRYYLTEEQYAWAEPRLHAYGALMGGPIAERAEITDKNPPQLVRYDRWGHEVSDVIIAESAKATKRDLVESGFMGPKFQRDADAAGVPSGPLGMASGYLLNQAEIGMSCAMGADAGMVAAQRYGAAELIDPRPYAVGSIRSTFERYGHMSTLLPAMGYSISQRHELEETIRPTPCDLVLVATPIDLKRVIKLDKPSLRVTYEVEEVTKPGLSERLAAFVRQHMPVKAGA